MVAREYCLLVADCWSAASDLWWTGDSNCFFPTTVKWKQTLEIWRSQKKDKNEEKRTLTGDRVRGDYTLQKVCHNILCLPSIKSGASAEKLHRRLITSLMEVCLKISKRCHSSSCSSSFLCTIISFTAAQETVYSDDSIPVGLMIWQWCASIAHFACYLKQLMCLWANEMNCDGESQPTLDSDSFSLCVCVCSHFSARGWFCSAVHHCDSAVWWSTTQSLAADRWVFANWTQDQPGSQ